MTATTMKSFAQSTGLAANKKSGGFSGKLLGKMAEGLEALEAIGALALNQGKRFMQLAQEAVKTYAVKLEASRTMPFATPDLEFNSPVNPQKAALRAPSLGMGAGGSRRQAQPQNHEKQAKQKKEDKT
jgi:hypothetical protein